jgi:dephospho-CoA kinase
MRFMCVTRVIITTSLTHFCVCVCVCVCVVEVEREASVQRLMQRNSLTEEQARQRVVAQCSSEERRVAAQRVFDNNECVSERVSGGVSERLRDEVLAALESVKATVVE